MVPSRFVVRPQQYTVVAAQAVSFAELFNAAFKEGVAGQVAYRVEITEPAGPSTGGGRQALQHIRLVPADGGSAIVVGSVNQVSKSAELRTYDHVSDLHAARFQGAQFPIDRPRYVDLLDRLQRFFDTEHFRVVVVDVTPSLAPPRPQPSRSAAPALLLVLALVLAIAGAVFVVLR